MADIQYLRMGFDTTILFALNNFASQNQFTVWLALFCATYLPFVICIALLITVWHLKTYSSREKLIFILSAATAALLARAAASIIRFFFPRPRPFVTYHIHQLVFFKTITPSFPSGHATFYFGLASLVYLYNPRLGMWAYIGAFIVCLGRVMVGVHYPTDVITGAFIGIVFGSLTYEFITPLYKRYMPRVLM